MPDPRDEPEQLLARVRSGDAAAAGELFTVLHDELRGIAGRMFRGQPSDHTLQPTAVLNEACIKLLRASADGPKDWKDRAHFLNLAARAMRQVLVSHARDGAARKRGGDAVRVTLGDVEGGNLSAAPDVLDVDSALTELRELDERQAQVAELRFFGGLENREIAEALGVSLRTVELDWRMAKTWLARRLGPQGPGAE